jgi:hypothetical protein
LILSNAPFAPGEAPPSLLTGFSGFDEPVSDQGRVSDQHRQSVADLAHLRRNGGPEITINAVLHAPADPRPPMSASLIGPSGSGTFRLSINAVSMSLL